MSIGSLSMLPGHRVGPARLATMGAVLALSVGVIAGCGSTTTKTTSTSSKAAKTTSSSTAKTSSASSTASKSSATAKTSSTSSAASTTGAQYAKYYKANGSATLKANTPLTIALSDFAYKPNTLTATPGEKVVLTLHNTATLTHTFVLGATKTDVSVNAGTTGTAKFTAPSKAGTYYFYCNIPGHAQQGMVGKLIVK